MLRSPIYAHHDPFVPQPDGDYSFTDQGTQRFSYILLPHERTWRQTGTVRLAAELNQPPIALADTYHPGPLPQKASYLSVEQENIVLGSMKKAEDNDDAILRFYETQGCATQARIFLPGWDRQIETEFRPGEIKTFRIPQDSTLPVVETNMIELEQ